MRTSRTLMAVSAVGKRSPPATSALRNPLKKVTLTGAPLGSASPPGAQMLIKGWVEVYDVRVLPADAAVGVAAVAVAAPPAVDAMGDVDDDASFRRGEKISHRAAASLSIFVAPLTSLTVPATAPAVPLALTLVALAIALVLAPPAGIESAVDKKDRKDNEEGEEAAASRRDRRPPQILLLLPLPLPLPLPLRFTGLLPPLPLPWAFFRLEVSFDKKAVILCCTE